MMGFLKRFVREHSGQDLGGLPDPALPPARRGDWDQAALTNVEITERVKAEIRAVTRPWNK